MPDPPFPEVRRVVRDLAFVSVDMKVPDFGLSRSECVLAKAVNTTGILLLLQKSISRLTCFAIRVASGTQ